LKKGDVDNNADDDDELRTSASQNHATATLIATEFFLRTQYLQYQQRGEGEGRGNRWAKQYLQTFPAGFLSSQPQHHTGKQGLQNQYN
jgi:hypothetical protein